MISRWCCVQMRQRAAAAMFEHSWSALERWRGARPMPGWMVRELPMACCLRPLYFSDLRKGVSKVASATDASEKGRCIMYSIGLPRSGHRFFKSAEDRRLHPARDEMALISPYDEIGGARRACELLAVPVAKYVAFEPKREAKRVVLSRYPTVSISPDASFSSELETEVEPHREVPLYWWLPLYRFHKCHFG